jgi:hypothetical protein
MRRRSEKEDFNYLWQVDPIYPEILKTITKRIDTDTSVIAAIRPITKLSGLYPLLQQSLEMLYAKTRDNAI